MPDARWRLCTPAGSAGAIAVFEIHGDADEALAAIGQAPLRTGELRLRDLCGVDRGIAVRWGDRVVHLMPHGGPGIVGTLAELLTRSGIAPAEPSSDPEYPEAADDLESRMLRTLARAASPLAIDLLLDQPRRWRERGGSSRRADFRLNRLIDPPLVVMLGASNVGKSTLTNAMAGRTVSIVANEPGTTRDHVGVLLDLAGLVVRFTDTPGLRPGAGASEQEAAAIARGLAERADLVLLCGDRSNPPPGEIDRVRSLRIALRADLGTPDWRHDAAVCAPSGQGVSTLVAAVRDALVPPSALHDQNPWEFWSPPGP